MNFLEEKILSDATIKPGNILKIDNFLNHQIDISIMRQMAYEMKRRFTGVEVNKVLTIEASGIALATFRQTVHRLLLQFVDSLDLFWGEELTVLLVIVLS